MGKTKTAFVTEQKTPDKSGKEAYEEKMRKKAAAQAAAEASGKQEASKDSDNKEVPTTAKVTEQKKSTEKIPADKKSKKQEKDQLKGVGLKGGEKIKVIGIELPEEDKKPATTEVAESTDSTEKRQKKAKVRSKNYKTAKAKVDINRLYKPDAAISLLKDIKYSKFDETVELHIVVKSKSQPINLTLPHSGGKQKRIEIADDATIEKLKTGKVEFDMLLATADMMPKLVPFARILGPKGLMPNPKNGTLIKSKKDAEKFSGNTLTLKTEKEQPVVHTAIGKLSQNDNELEENAKAVLNAFPKQVVKAYIKSTMSPSIKLSV